MDRAVRSAAEMEAGSVARAVALAGTVSAAAELGAAMVAVERVGVAVAMAAVRVGAAGWAAPVVAVDYRASQPRLLLGRKHGKLGRCRH